MLEYFYRQTYIHKTFPPHLFKKIKKKNLSCLLGIYKMS